MSLITKKIPLMDAAAQYKSIKKEIDLAVNRVLAGGNYIMGPHVKGFEKAVADYCGVKYAVGVANGTDALLLTLDALGIGPGDEVITTPFTFFSTAEAISQRGATPIFVDICQKTYNIDANLLEKAVTSRTKAIIPVHLFGQPADMDEILEIAERHGLYVIEDACQAMGASYKGRPAGSMGKAGCFSFFPTKNLGGFGDGGMVVTDDEELAQKIGILRTHGSHPKYYHSHMGYNSRLDELQAAMLQVKLPYLDQWNQSRRDKAARYHQALSSLPLGLPVESNDRNGIYHLYIIQTEERDELGLHLEANGIATGIYYPVPLHLQGVYRNLGYSKGNLPEAEKASMGTLALPLYPELDREGQEYVITIMHEFFRKKGGLNEHGNGPTV